MLEWFHEDLKRWILEGCDNEIALRVIKLTMHEVNLKILPKEIGFLINLKELSFYHCKISTLIPEIGNLINLKLLN